MDKLGAKPFYLMLLNMLLLILTALLTLSPSTAHDFHVSRCEIVYRSQSKSLEITQHMFADDVEIALRKMLGSDESLHLSTELETEAAEPALQDYLNDRLGISVNGKPVDLDYLGREPGDDNAAMWVYVEGLECATPVNVSVRYDLLLETFSDQKNILSFQVDNGEKKMFLIDRANPEVSFEVK